MKFQPLVYRIIVLGFACLLLSGPASADALRGTGQSGVDPTRSPQLTNAIQKGLDRIERSGLIQGCVAEMVREGPKLCTYFNPLPTLQSMGKQLEASRNQIQALTPRHAVDPAPFATLGALEAEEDKIGDFLGVVNTDLHSIERCSGGPASPGCTVLRSTCFGDWKCYGDGTCACYTCHKGGIPGSCGID